MPGSPNLVAQVYANIGTGWTPSVHRDCSCDFEYHYRWPQFYDALLSGDATATRTAVELLEERDRALEQHLGERCGAKVAYIHAYPLWDLSYAQSTYDLIGFQTAQSQFGGGATDDTGGGDMYQFLLPGGTYTITASVEWQQGPLIPSPGAPVTLNMDIRVYNDTNSIEQQRWSFVGAGTAASCVVTGTATYESPANFGLKIWSNPGPGQTSSTMLNKYGDGYTAFGLSVEQTDAVAEQFEYPTRWSSLYDGFLSADTTRVDTAVDVLDERDRALETHIAGMICYGTDYAHGRTCEFDYPSRWPQLAPMLLSGDAEQVRAAVGLLQQRDIDLETHLTNRVCGDKDVHGELPDSVTQVYENVT